MDTPEAVIAVLMDEDDPRYVKLKLFIFSSYPYEDRITVDDYYIVLVKTYHEHYKELVLLFADYKLSEKNDYLDGLPLDVIEKVIELNEYIPKVKTK